MILADTSVWADHIREPDPQLSAALDNDTLFCHPFVIGELALGSLPDRRQFISMLRQLPTPLLATHEDVMLFIDSARLHSRGVGYVDACLLSSVLITEGSTLLTRDKRLASAAEELGVLATSAG